MKKALLFSLLLVFSSSLSFAQDHNDNSLADNTETETEFSSIVLLDYPIMDSYLLTCYIKSNGDYSYTLSLGINKKHIMVSGGNKLLIKFEDGSMMEFTSTMSLKEDVAIYSNIPESEMEKLVSKKITKIRIGHDSGYLDQETTDNQFSKDLKQSHEILLQKVLPNYKIDIYSDF